jgi:hypothetical protein
MSGWAVVAAGYAVAAAVWVLLVLVVRRSRSR